MAFFYEEGEEKKRSGVFMRHVNIGYIAENEDGSGSYAPSRIFIDPTLTQEGEAAEAKATGDAIKALAEQTNAALDELSETTETAINDLSDATEEAINSLAAIGVIEDTKSGEVVSISDSAAYKMQGLRLYGKSTQATTTGAQLLDVREGVSSSPTGVTVTADGTGGVTINGTTGSGGQADIYFVGSWDSPEVLFEEDTYTFSVDGLSADENLYVVNNQSVVKQSIGTGSCTVTSQITGLCIRLKADKTYSNIKIYPMLSASSSAKPWEPYTGGKPSPSPEYPQEIESAGDGGNISLRISGLNLINVEPDQTLSVSNVMNEFLAVENQMYTVTMSQTLVSEGIGGNRHSQHWYKCLSSSGEILYESRICNMDFREIGETIKKAEVFKAPKGTVKVQIFINPYFGASSCTVINNYTMVLLGNNVNRDYESYKPAQFLTYPTPNGLPGIPVESGGNYTDAEGQQWICDEVDFGRGKYVQRVKIRGVESGDNGNISNTTSTEELNRCYINVPGKLPQKTGVRCNALTYSKDYIYNTIPENYIIDEASTNVLFAVAKNYGSTFEEIRQKLIIAGAKILYALATPVETDLTPEQLAAYAALTTYKPNTTVTTDSSPAAGVSVDYVADTKTYIDNKFAQLAELSTVVNALIGADE